MIAPLWYSKENFLLKSVSNLNLCFQIVTVLGMIAFIVAIWKVTTGDDDGDDLLGVDCDKEDTLNAAQKAGTHITQEKAMQVHVQ